MSIWRVAFSSVRWCLSSQTTTVTELSSRSSSSSFTAEATLTLNSSASARQRRCQRQGGGMARLTGTHRRSPQSIVRASALDALTVVVDLSEGVVWVIVTTLCLAVSSSTSIFKSGARTLEAACGRSFFLTFFRGDGEGVWGILLGRRKAVCGCWLAIEVKVEKECDPRKEKKQRSRDRGEEGRT